MKGGASADGSSGQPNHISPLALTASDLVSRDEETQSYSLYNMINLLARFLLCLFMIDISPDLRGE